jgi:hypothetical protein
MAKIGRNDKCPCRSGKKYKHCCANKQQVVQDQSKRITLMDEVRVIQADAEKRLMGCRELGVFFFFSTLSGDAWLLEMTECDCVQLACDGVALAPPIEENSETIEINYSHTFSLENRQLVLTAYSDKSIQVLANAPSRELSAAMRRIKRKLSKEQLQTVHLPTPDTTAAG